MERPGLRQRTTATSPPLGGVSECLGGRSSDLQAAYLLQLPGSWLNQCFEWERSFLLTAAGQFRILTGFPSSSCDCVARNHKVSELYLAYEKRTSAISWVRCGNVAKLKTRNWVSLHRRASLQLCPLEGGVSEIAEQRSMARLESNRMALEQVARVALAIFKSPTPDNLKERT